MISYEDTILLKKMQFRINTELKNSLKMLDIQIFID